MTLIGVIKLSGVFIVILRLWQRLWQVSLLRYRRMYRFPIHCQTSRRSSNLHWNTGRSI